MLPDSLNLTLRRIPPVLLLFWVGLLLVMVVTYVRLPTNSPPRPAGAEIAAAVWPEPDPPPEAAWQVFRVPSAKGAGTLEDVQSRYRLAGIFFMMDGDEATGSQVRKAILDDIKRQEQVLLQEGDRTHDFELTQIFSNRVVLRRGMQEITLTLSFSDSPVRDPTGVILPAAEVPWDQQVLEETRFGKRIAENRWILQRQELLHYRDELLDDPERLAALFLSMKADRNEAGKVAGYRLEKQGENLFYDAVGLKESDVIRKTNSMPMTRQERAEYFIREFVDDKLSAVVLDIERNGEPMKLIYYLR
jgi:type II secretory pathway component PulC